MKIDGACHCGKITYEAEVDPEGTRICHCTDCQVLAGSAFRAVIPSLEGGFRLITGEPRIYVKVADSGRSRAQAFCPDCGTHLYAVTAEESDPKVYGIRLGSVRQRDQFVPKSQIWCRSAQPWLGELETMQQVEKQS